MVYERIRAYETDKSCIITVAVRCYNRGALFASHDVRIDECINNAVYTRFRVSHDVITGLIVAL